LHRDLFVLALRDGAAWTRQALPRGTPRRAVTFGRGNQPGVGREAFRFAGDLTVNRA